jgi:polysaccharide export outer membrane protein
MKSLNAIVVLIALLLLTASRAATGQQTRQSISDSAQLIGPGDILRVVVWRQPELSGDFPVAIDGSLKHPLFRNVFVDGLTLSEARQRIAGVLVAFTQNPQFIVEPLFRVAVGGQVRAPQLLSVPRETSVLQAVQMAGGPAEDGRMDRVRLIRRGRETTFNLTNLTGADAQTLVSSGDQIIVPARGPSVGRVLVSMLPTLSSLLSIYYIATHR